MTSYSERTRFLLSTVTGLEPFVVSEFTEKMEAATGAAPAPEEAPYGYSGSVLIKTDMDRDAVLEVAMAMRSIHHILELLHVFELPAEDHLEAMKTELRRIPIQAMEATKSFRVSCKRLGDHDFGSMDVEREVGQVMVDRYGRKVDLEHYETQLRVNVYKHICIVGLQLTRKPLTHRYKRAYLPRVTLRTSSAYAMLRLSGLTDEKGTSILDPFCGSGTLLMEAAHVFPNLEVHGGDANPRAVSGCKRNLEQAGLYSRIQLHRINARHLTRHFPPDRFDAIVTNPPYGLKMGQGTDMGALYGSLFRQGKKILKPHGKMVVMVWKKYLFERINKEEGFFDIERIDHLESGGAYLHIFTLMLHSEKTFEEP